MARRRSYLRGLSICVTVLLLVSGIVMIGAGFSSMDGNIPVAELFEDMSNSDGLLVLQVFGPITVILSLAGICAASFNLKPLLLLFSALIFIEFVALLVVASPLLQVQVELDSRVDEVFLNVTSLHAADVYVQRELNKLQASAEFLSFQDSCCGLRSFEDWGNHLPASCVCSRDRDVFFLENACTLVTSSGHRLNSNVPVKLWVHSKPCGSILKSHLSFPIKLRIGIISAFSTITMVAIVLCLTLGLEEQWRTPPVETTVDDFNRVKYQPKPSLG